MKDIFITGTFRNDWNKEFNLRLADILESKGWQIFLPQRDSEQLGNRKETFLQDVAGIDQCKMIVAEPKPLIGDLKLAMLTKRSQS